MFTIAVWILFLLMIFGLNVAVPADATQDTLARRSPPPIDEVINLQVDASTWRPRGRISFGIGPTVRMKLASAGLTVTDDPDKPHDATMKVEYREKQGKPISVGLFGTEIICVIRLDNPPEEQSLLLFIHESPSYADLLNAPYVEVVEKLQANPYFYFLGEIVRERIRTHIDATGALIQALDRQFYRELHPPPVSPLDTLVSPGETFPDLDIHFAAAAQQNAVDELGRLKDSRAIDVLQRFTLHANRLTRIRAVVALGQFDDPSVVPIMMRVAETDGDAAVRDAAVGLLAKRLAR